jgi:hypothetical protein
MTALFRQYESSFDELKCLMQDELPRSLRLFNIRFRLAVDIEIDFNGRVSLTKSTQVRETYILIIKLMEVWNAYEALSKYANETSEYVSKGVSKSKTYSQSFLKQIGSISILEGALNWLKSEYENKDQFRTDFIQYIKRIENDPDLSKSLKDDANCVLAHLKNEKSISGIEILSLIYAERNMYYHNGETAKMGMAYSNRIRLIDKYRESLTTHMLNLANFLIAEQICKNR